MKKNFGDTKNENDADNSIKGLERKRERKEDIATEIVSSGSREEPDALALIEAG